MLLGILTLITALSISAVAIYYSVAGLVAIFAAAALPIMIMGGVLEVGKLVTAVWLHRYWKQATWWLKSYLSIAVLVLMLITSMGIFGFLSKAHIEQTAQSTDNLAQVETLQSEIDRNLAIIGRAENKIRELDNSQSNADTTIQEQIDKEQERIDTAYDRVQPLIDEQNRSLEDQIALFGLDKVDAKIAALEEAMNINTRDRDDVRVLQSMVGARPDGAYGSGTAAKVEEYRNNLNTERDRILEQIQTVRTATNNEIARIRKGAEDQIAQSNTLINRLRNQLGTQDNAESVQTAIDEQNERIRTVSNEVDRLTEEKIALESEYRKLEAEVGPIKYIAEFVYGDTADNNMLEEAVRWVIIVIIFVFDPLAVLLLIASQYTFEWRRSKDDNGGWLRRYEQARAQRIVDNPGYTVDVPKETSDENREEDREEATQDVEELRTGQDEESIPPEIRDDTNVAETSQEERSIDDVARDYITTNDTVRDMVPENDTTMADADDSELEQSEVQTDDLENWNRWVEAAEAEVQKENQKQIPDTRNRLFYPEELDKTKESYIMKENGKQVTKETKPQYTDVVTPEGYIQNEEQNDPNRLWNKINKPKDE